MKKEPQAEETVSATTTTPTAKPASRVPSRRAFWWTFLLYLPACLPVSAVLGWMFVRALTETDVGKPLRNMGLDLDESLVSVDLSSPVGMYQTLPTWGQVAALIIFTLVHVLACLPMRTVEPLPQEES